MFHIGSIYIKLLKNRAIHPPPQVIVCLCGPKQVILWRFGTCTGEAVIHGPVERQGGPLMKIKLVLKEGLFFYC